MVSSTPIISASKFFAQMRAIIAESLRYWAPGDRASTTSNNRVAITGHISSLEIGLEALSNQRPSAMEKMKRDSKHGYPA